MIPAPFEYYRAKTVEEALELIKKFGDEAKVLAGGQSLIPMLKLRFARYSKIIDIGRLQELKYIRQDGDIVRIGGLTTHREVEKSQLVKDKVPVLSLCASEIADVQVRNMGTIAGSLSHADPSADYPPTMLALGATLVAKGAKGSREIPVDNFFVGTFTTALEPDELLVEVKVPVMKNNERAYYMKIGHPATGFAIVNCAVKLSLNNGRIDSARVALGGFVTVPYRDSKVEEFLTGKEANLDTIKKASELVGEGQDIIGDYYADADYRRSLAKALFVRVVRTALGV
ncbi:MAG: xanthine dehydrogenase family protein subunit M [Hydrogenobacter sp.]